MDPLLQAGVALITGAGSGIGQQIAVTFAQRGCTKLYLADINSEGLERTSQLIMTAAKNVNIATGVVDVSDEKAVQGMIQACVKEYGRIDFAINNAGIGKGSVRTTETSVDMLDQIYKINQRGIFLCEKHEIQQMLTQEPLRIFDSSHNEDRGTRGSIINTASLSATSVLPMLSAYTSSKHAILVSSRVNARQYAPHKIRINTISPGFVKTPMMSLDSVSQEFLDAAKANSPMNRMTLPVEVAEAAAFLSSSRASGITGVDLPIDSGARLFHYV